jgi:hypothetical protein
MANGSHGSLERMPGALFRAMGALFLRKKDCSREALARELQEHLETLGVDYHVRTLKRQLTGRVSSVPPEVQGAMRHVLLRANGLQTDLDIENALRAARLRVSPEEREPAYLSPERIVPLVQLWLLFNPTHSRRSLAAVLSERLACRGVQLTVDPLQNILAGRQPLARRKVHDALLALLSAYGIASEADARARWQQQRNNLAAYLQDRVLESADRLVDLARAWKLRTHRPSSRHLAVILQQKLREHGLVLGVHGIQKALYGNAKHVRRALIVEMEGLFLPTKQRERADVPAVQRKDVEGDERGRAAPKQKRVELRAPVAIEADHLTVEHSRTDAQARAQLGRERRELSEAVAVAGYGVGAVAVHVGKRPIAVVLQLEQPLRIVKRVPHATQRERREARDRVRLYRGRCDRASGGAASAANCPATARGRTANRLIPSLTRNCHLHE